MEKHRQLAMAALRERAGLTQTELALAVEVSQTSVSHWEQGQAIPPTKAASVLAVLRAKDRAAVPSGLKPTDLSRPWDEVVLERASAKPVDEPRRAAPRAPAGRAAAKARA